MRSHNQISKIALGTVQFGVDYGISNNNGITSIDEIGKIISYCNEVGISTLDTASAYGMSEVNIGKFDLENFSIVSKFIDDDGVDISDSLKNSCSKLNLDKLYGYLFHRPLEALENNSWDKMTELKKQGFIQKIGFSFNTVEEIEEVLSKGLIPDLIQIPFNIFDDRFKRYAIELKQKYKTEIHTRSTFLQGLFFLDINNIPPYFSPIKHVLSDVKSQYKEKIHLSLLDFAVNQNFIDKVVIGVNNKAQLEENLNFVNLDSQYKINDNIKVEDKFKIPSLWKI